MGRALLTKLGKPMTSISLDTLIRKRLRNSSKKLLVKLDLNFLNLNLTRCSPTGTRTALERLKKMRYLHSSSNFLVFESIFVAYCLMFNENIQFYFENVQRALNVMYFFEICFLIDVSDSIKIFLTI